MGGGGGAGAVGTAAKKGVAVVIATTTCYEGKVESWQGSSALCFEFAALMRQRCLANHGSNRQKEGHSVYWINAFGTAAVASPSSERKREDGARAKANGRAILQQEEIYGSGGGLVWRRNAKAVDSGALGGEQRAGCSRVGIALQGCSKR